MRLLLWRLVASASQTDLASTNTAAENSRLSSAEKSSPKSRESGRIVEKQAERLACEGHVVLSGADARLAEAYWDDDVSEHSVGTLHRHVHVGWIAQNFNSPCQDSETLFRSG